jgi:hypothetical protein
VGSHRGAAGLPRRVVGFITANLISKTVSKAIHAPPADGPCRNVSGGIIGVASGKSLANNPRPLGSVSDSTQRAARVVFVFPERLTIFL